MPRRAELPVRFVGRSEHLAALEHHLASVAEGRPHTVCLYGDPGIGKTQLVREFLRRAGPAAVLWASADETESDLPFGVTDQLLVSLPRAARAGAPARAEERARVAEDPRARPMVVGGAMLDAVGTLPGPVVLVVDNFHWADRQSADALLFLLRRLRVEPVLTVLTTQRYQGGTDARGRAVRPDQSWWRFLLDPATATRMPLEGLEPDDLAELAAHLGHEGLTRAAVRSLHHHTGGHPLHFRSLLDEVDVQALARMSGLPPAPRSFGSLVRAQFEALSPPTRDLVAAGAVLGQTFTPEQAAELGGVAEAGAALDEARDAGILTSVPGSTGFAHALTRAAVYHALPWGTRRALHEGAARVTSGATSLAHRASATTGYDLELATSFMMLGLSQVQRGEYPQASDSLLHAARLTADRSTREQVLLRAVALVCLTNDHAAAETHRADVEACAEGPQRTFVLGLMAFVAGRPAEARALLGLTVSAPAEEVPEMQRTRAAVTLAFACVQLGDWEAALEAAEVADGGSLDWERAVALSSAVLALARLGRSEEAVRRAVAFRVSDPAAPGGADAQVGHGTALLLDGDPAGAEAQLEQAVRRARAGEPVRLTEFALTNLAESRYHLGRWDEALTDLELATTLATDTSRSDALTRAHALGAWLAAGQGRFAEAEDHVRAARSAQATAGSAFGERLVTMAQALLARAQGDAPGMLAAVAAAVDGDLDVDRALTGLPSWQAVAVEALVIAGPPDLATDALDRFAGHLCERRFHPWADDVARLRGRLAEARHDAEAAEAAYQEGLRRAPGPLAGGPARALLHAAYGDLLTDLGRRREAIDHLMAAREAAVALSAAPLRERCDEELLRCGLPIPADGAQGWSLLTPAEARVARLVSRGMSNRQTAAELYVSTKTVEYHLGHVFAKLGLTSRSELAQALSPR